MVQSFENELNKPVHEDIYSEMYEALYGLQDDFDLYRGKIDEALMLITIMEQRQADFIKKYGTAPPVPVPLSRESSERRSTAYKPEVEYTRYPAYQRQLDGFATESPTVYSSKSVKVPEKYLYEDDAPKRESSKRRQESKVGKQNGKKTKAVAKHARPAVEKTEEKTKSKKQQRVARAKDAIYYLVLVILVSAVLIVNIFSGEGVRSFAGFSAFMVKSSSMEDVYPKNSIILTHRVEPSKLKIGDDITFFSNATTTITHRIIAVYEDYEQTGQRGFETKGTMNEKPDKDIVPAINVIGKVVFCSALIGSLLVFIGKNWPLLIFFAVVIVALVLVLKKILKD